MEFFSRFSSYWSSARRGLTGWWKTVGQFTDTPARRSVPLALNCRGVPLKLVEISNRPPVGPKGMWLP